MKRITMILLCLIFSSCKNEIKPKSILNLDFIQTYSGKINNKYPFHIKITSNEGKITGNYFYDKLGENIELKGLLSKDSILTLNEFDKKGNQTGAWKGKFLNLNKAEGNWSKPNGKSNKSFYFIKTSDNYQTIKKEINLSKEKREKTTMVIYDIKVLKYPNTRESGKTWDSMFGRYKPDVYVKILDINKKVLYNQYNRLENHTGNPFSLRKVTEKEVLKRKSNYITEIPKEKYKKGIYFCLYDFDQNSEDDLISVIGITTFKKHYDSEKITQIFDLKGFKIEVQFYYK